VFTYNQKKDIGHIGTKELDKPCLNDHLEAGEFLSGPIPGRDKFSRKTDCGVEVQVGSKWVPLPSADSLLSW
jgi:hypothetical protein